MKQGIRVFVSIAYLDNEERRKLVVDALLRAELVPVGMERFAASLLPAAEVCRKHASECDLYLGIVAHRYGSIADGHAVSYTELEYDAAKAAGKPRLMFEIEAGAIVIDRDFDPEPLRWDKQKLLAAFRTKYAGDQMPARFNDQSLGMCVHHAVVEWLRERAGEGEKVSEREPETSPELAEIVRYREAILARYQHLDFAGFKTKLRVPIGLEELYVPLDALADQRVVGDAAFGSAKQAEDELRALEAAREIALVDAFRVSQQGKRRGVVILGDPGSGKTTHLKRLLLWCVRDKPELLGLASSMLPVFMPLRELADLRWSLEQFIEHVFGREKLGLAQGFAQTLLARGRLLFLFDGLDEVADPERRAEAARWVEQNTAARGNCASVVTCRFAGYSDKTRLDQEFLELHLRPMSREQSEAFIRAWYKNVETGLPGADRARAEQAALEGAEALIARLREPDFRAARILEMTRNPLLLFNLCLVHRDRKDLPRDRVRLYEECVEVLLERWRDGRGLPVAISAKAGRRALQPAALWLHEQVGRLRATGEELARVLAPALESVRWKGGDAGSFLRAVRDESGLLTGFGQNEYGFMHLGFQEYLAACEIRRRHFEGDPDVLRELAEKYGDSWWQEVILITLALGNPSLFEPFMREVVKLDAFAKENELLEFLLEESAEVSEKPFVELLEQAPGRDRALWARQREAFRVLERIGAKDTLARPSLRGMGRELGEALRDISIGTRVVENQLTGAIRLEDDVATGLIVQAAELRLLVTDPGGVELIFIPGGTFLMGSPTSEWGRWDAEGPQHQVTLESFWIGRYPVTNAEYARFLEANPKAVEPDYWADRSLNQPRQPVVGVSWDEAKVFATWAGARLPTEAEWEYACRADTTGSTYAGEIRSHDDPTLHEIAWYSENSGGTSHAVGEKRPNAWGLHDMLGNVSEWCEDRFERYTSGRKPVSDGIVDPTRVIRGGGLFYNGRVTRSAHRSSMHPSTRGNCIGFRLARDR